MAATMGQGLPEATCLPLPRMSFPEWEGLGSWLSQEVLTSRLEDLHLIPGIHSVQHGSLTTCNPSTTEAGAQLVEPNQLANVLRNNG